ncbi:TPA: phosphoribosylformylglycinamidine cyclo-ligase [Streptococcus pneumoniae]
MTYEVKSLNEECGVFGIWGHPDAAKLTYFGLHSLQHRGQEGAGILSNDQGQLKRHRDMGLLSEVFRNPANLDKLTGAGAIGHVRYATAGEASVDNIQPFLFRFHDMQFGLAHNGNLTNAASLKKELEQRGAIFSATSDSEILAHLIRRSHNPSLMGKIKEALSLVKGGFAYILLFEDKLIAALDPNGFRPLSIGKMANGAVVVSSETCAFEVIGAEWICDLKPGEIVIIDDEGIQYDSYTDDTQLAICSMEYIYFARPDSNIHGVNVHTARKRMGAQLAREFKHEADIVVGVPNSSLSAAMGFAEESGLPNEMGLIKNQYTQRTFIQPTQELREQGVRMKLSAVSGVVKGKRVVMVDDSIVRGTTSRRIVQLLKEAGYEVVERIKKHVARTERAGVMGALGGFGGMFDLSKTGVKEPVLISGTDGVGTKLMLAIKYDKHDTIGQDCVAMCVNDIIAAGAEPLYFLDYVATGKNEPAKLEQVVAGVAEGCVQAGAALIGGETAEMPGMYGEDDYDLAGFAVGVAEKSQIIDGSKVVEGDVLLGLASSGIHSNGYSLVRRVFADYTGEEVLPELEGKKLKEVLLEPTRIYVKAVLPLIKEELVNGIAHITGGGFIENVPRMFADDLAAEIDESKVPVLPIFKALEKYGQIKHEEMFEIFNMGVGLMLAVSPENVERVKELLDEAVYEIGRIVKKENESVIIK